MEYKFLGRSGLKVSSLCLGPYSSTIVDRTESARFGQIIETYIKAGGNFIDLSDAYSGAEKMFGEWLASKNGEIKRSDLIIATKTGFPVGAGPNDIGLSRRHIIAALEKSLEELKTDYVDLYQLHCL